MKPLPSGLNSRLAGVAGNGNEANCGRPEPASVGELVGKAGMAELADAADSKSAEGNLVGVRPPLPAPTKSMI